MNGNTVEKDKELLADNVNSKEKQNKTRVIKSLCIFIGCISLAQIGWYVLSGDGSFATGLESLPLIVLSGAAATYHYVTKK